MDRSEIAPKLRREILDAHEAQGFAKTQREAREQTGRKFAYLKALDMIVDAGLDSPGIASGTGYRNPHIPVSLIEYLGEQNAERLGLAEYVAAP